MLTWLILNRNIESFNSRSHIGSDIIAMLPLQPRPRFNSRSHIGSDRLNIKHYI
nr:MAG TPA_asm: hypothetical protein [Caudoviricetes sp.]